MVGCRIIAIFLLGICITGLLTGCKNVAIVPKEQINLVDTNYQAIDDMLIKAKMAVGRDVPIIVATFVNLDDVTSTSKLGRVMGELCAARLTQRGYRVVNIRMRPDSVVIKPRQGEFLLSRDVAVLSKEHGAQVVLVGTYTRTDVIEKIRSVNQQLETVDPELMTRASYMQGEKRVFETIDDSLYVSLRLVNAKDHSVMAAHDYRITIDENVESLLFHSDDDSTARY